MVTVDDTLQLCYHSHRLTELVGKHFLTEFVGKHLFSLFVSVVVEHLSCWFFILINCKQSCVVKNE